jgi:flagellar motor switch protein FliG
LTAAPREADNQDMTAKIGIAGALEILEGLDPATRERILGEIQSQQPEIYEQLRTGLLNMENLLKLEDSQLRVLLQAVPREKWARALRACSPELKERLMSNLPTRARADMNELIQAVGPQPLSEVRRIQSEIALEAKTRFESK